MRINTPLFYLIMVWTTSINFNWGWFISALMIDILFKITIFGREGV